jgi:hypothetical protein
MKSLGGSTLTRGTASTHANVLPNDSHSQGGKQKPAGASRPCGAAGTGPWLVELRYFLSR